MFVAFIEEAFKLPEILALPITWKASSIAPTPPTPRLVTLSCVALIKVAFRLPINLAEPENTNVSDQLKVVFKLPNSTNADESLRNTLFCDELKGLPANPVSWLPSPTNAFAVAVPLMLRSPIEEKLNNCVLITKVVVPLPIVIFPETLRFPVK